VTTYINLLYKDVEPNINVPYEYTFCNLFGMYEREIPSMESYVTTLNSEAINYMVHLSQLHIIRAMTKKFPCPNIMSWLI
jgi:hypothetical protein